MAVNDWSKVGAFRGTVKELLLAAADHLDRVGLCQGAFFSNGGSKDSPCCIRGAMMAVAGHDPCEARLAVRKFLALPDDGNREELAKWNDTPGRTKEEVVTALRGTAEMLTG